MVWTDDSAERFRAWVLPDGGSKTRLNAAGTQSFSSSIDGTAIAFDEYTRRDADIRFTDAASLQRTNPPSGVNTRAVESDPAVSGDWMMFIRANHNRVRPRDAYLRLILFNLQTGEKRVLVDVRFNRWYVASGQVNGDWAAFESCRYSDGTFSDCDVFRYQISTDEMNEISNPGLQQYAAAVAADGTMYFTRGGRSGRWVCGRGVTLVRAPLVGPQVEISSLAYPNDVLEAFAFGEHDLSTTVLLGHLVCDFGNAGLYQLPNAEDASVDA